MGLYLRFVDNNNSQFSLLSELENHSRLEQMTAQGRKASLREKFVCLLCPQSRHLEIILIIDLGRKVFNSTHLL